MTHTGLTLNKYLADCGLCSRRNAAELIKAGRIFVNDVVVDNPAYRVQEGDRVTYKGQLIKPADKVYILLNKPKGYVSSVSDPIHTKTVVKLVAGVTKDRVYPVGRLDIDSTGLMLLTNDGDLAQKLSHPKYEVRKVYYVSLDQPISEVDLQKIRKGVTLADGYIAVDRVYKVAEKKGVIGLELHSGKNRVVRRIFLKLGYKVRSLDRVEYAHLVKRGLKPGSWRLLTSSEVIKLKKQ